MKTKTIFREVLKKTLEESFRASLKPSFMGWQTFKRRFEAFERFLLFWGSSVFNISPPILKISINMY